MDLSQFADRLSYIKRHYGLTQRELAMKLQLASSSVNSLLQGINKPSYDVLLAVHREFPDFSWSWIMTGKDEESTDKATSLQEADVLAELERVRVERDELQIALRQMALQMSSYVRREPTTASLPRLGKTLRNRTQRPATEYAQYIDGNLIPLYFPGTSSAPAAA